MSQVESTGRSKGGKVTKASAILRQSYVEKFMKMGYSLTKISTIKIENKKLGSLETISKDMNIIRSRWLNEDPEWFNRARIARIEAKGRLLEQLTRLSDLILELRNGDYNREIHSNKEGGSFVTESNADLPKKLVYTESQLTTVITRIYEIDADFDPEQYLNHTIQESMENKIKETTTATS